MRAVCYADTVVSFMLLLHVSVRLSLEAASALQSSNCLSGLHHEVMLLSDVDKILQTKKAASGLVNEILIDLNEKCYIGMNIP